MKGDWSAQLTCLLAFLRFKANERRSYRLPIRLEYMLYDCKNKTSIFLLYFLTPSDRHHLQVQRLAECLVLGSSMAPISDSEIRSISLLHDCPFSCLVILSSPCAVSLALVLIT